MIPWYVCVLVTSILAVGFFALGALLKERSATETNRKLRHKLEIERDNVLRYLKTLGSLIDEKIVADKKLAEHYNNEKDVSLSYIYEGLSKQWTAMKADLDALIWFLSMR